MSDPNDQIPGEPVSNETSPSCALSLPDQNRNLVLFACCTGLQYLAAPVLYVGVTQAALCEQLKADIRTSNLPATLFFAMTAAPALFAWAFPYVSWLKRNLVTCYLATAAMLAVMAWVLIVPCSSSVRLAVVITQGAVSGIFMPAAIAFLWEAVGRGTEESRRGLALSLAFGAGPLLAVAGSLGSQLLLSGEVGTIQIEGLVYPWNFACLFGAGVPVMCLAAFLASRFVVPLPEQEASRAPFSSVADLSLGILLGLGALYLYHTAPDDVKDEDASRVAAEQAADADNESARNDTDAEAGRTAISTHELIGHVLLFVAGCLFVHHFRDILSQRQLLLATIVTVLLYSGNTIPSNMNLYSSEVLKDLGDKVQGEDVAGYQNTLRFGFKVVAGFLLGLLLTKTNPRAGILMTGSIFVAAQLWAIFATGLAWLIAFGIYGAGELIGVYAPNYILSASRESQIRRNMAFVTMLMVPAAPTGYLFGAITDYIHRHDITAFGTTSSRAFGFQASFATCAALMTLGLILAVCVLPKNPQRHDAE